MNTTPVRKNLHRNLMALPGLAAAAGTALAVTDSMSTAISPVSNPIYFESALIQSEVRPIYMHHQIDDGFIGGNANLYALQLRWAVTERLAIIATKDGYIDLNPEAIPGADGWADVAAGVKYAVVKDEARALVITPGLTFEIPLGQEKVFQGNGDGLWNVFVSGMKGWGNLHLSGNAGFNVPNNTDEETANFHASLQLDYHLSRWFIPLVSFNSFTTLNAPDDSEFGAQGFDTEGFDLINFGSGSAKGITQAAVGVGFRSRVLESLDFGFAYEWGITETPDIFYQRATVDAIWRF
ncbi:MAG: hypothetical protein J0L84_03645 [Verrucomicrobia bacterium]|nr:hypothetical protein [Verrucomicrobiota bacterium]